MKYRLLALDVDGTLARPDNTVDPRIVAAVAAVAAAGVRVCLATGRSYVETMPVWRQLDLPGPHEPLVLIGGALVSEPGTGRTLYHRTISRDLACEFADALGEEGFSAMAIVDVWRHGVDYYLAESGDVHDAQRQWFSKMNVAVRSVPRLAHAEELPDPLRVSAVVDADRAMGLADRLRDRFDGRLRVHAIVAPNYAVTIVEAFATGTDKFDAVKYVAQAYAIPPGQIVAVGDDVNDVGMVEGAGLGVAVPESVPALLAVADVVAEPALPEFLMRLAAGEAFA